MPGSEGKEEQMSVRIGVRGQLGLWMCCFRVKVEVGGEWSPQYFSISYLCIKPADKKVRPSIAEKS